MSHNNFAQHHYNAGNLVEALRCFLRTWEYCSTSKHVVEMCLSVIRVAIESNIFVHVSNYVSKAEQATAPLEPATVAKLMVSDGLAHLDASRYKMAAKKFVEAPIELGTSYNDVQEGVGFGEDVRELDEGLKKSCREGDWRV